MRYADDIVLIADSVEKLQKILDKVVSESESKGLTINCKKTKCLVVSKQKTRPNCNITIKNESIEQVDKFEYLGSLIMSDAKCDQEINRRIGMTEATFHKMKRLLCNSKLAMKTKLRLLECYVISSLTYSSECWTISENMKKRIEATELWFLRRMLKIPWTSYTSNEEVLQRDGSKRKLLCNIRKRQFEFLGHVMRKEEIENLVVTGKIDGKRDRNRQRMTSVKSLSNWMNASPIKIIQTAKNRVDWKIMVTNALSGYGT